MFILCLKRLKVAHLVLKQSKVAPDRQNDKLLERKAKSCSKLKKLLTSCRAPKRPIFDSKAAICLTDISIFTTRVNYEFTCPGCKSNQRTINDNGQ
jgi:hypothetical protein